MHLSLRSKLLASFGTGALLLCAVGLAGWHATSGATAGLRTLYQDESAAASALRSASRGLLELRTGSMAGSYITSSDDARRTKLRQDDQEWLKAVDVSIATYAATHLSDAETKRLEEWRASYPTFLDLRLQLIAMMDSAVKT